MIWLILGFFWFKRLFLGFWWSKWLFLGFFWVCWLFLGGFGFSFCFLALDLAYSLGDWLSWVVVELVVLYNRKMF